MKKLENFNKIMEGFPRTIHEAEYFVEKSFLDEASSSVCIFVEKKDDLDIGDFDLILIKLKNKYPYLKFTGRQDGFSGKVKFFYEK